MAIGEIRGQSRIKRELLTGGTTENKAMARSALATAAAKISAALGIWAEVCGDAELAEKARVTRSSLLVARELDVAERADALLGLAVKHLDQLGKYGVDQARLDRFEVLCEEFSFLIGRPRAIIVERKTVNRSLAELFSEADLHLSRMDRLCPVLAEGYPQFVVGFQANRALIPVPATRELSDRELANAVLRLDQKLAAEANKEADKASQDAELARKAAERQAQEERLQAARTGEHHPKRKGFLASSGAKDGSAYPSPITVVGPLRPVEEVKVAGNGSAPVLPS